MSPRVRQDEWGDWARGKTSGEPELENGKSWPQVEYGSTGATRPSRATALQNSWFAFPNVRVQAYRCSIGSALNPPLPRGNVLTKTEIVRRTVRDDPASLQFNFVLPKDRIHHCGDKVPPLLDAARGTAPYLSSLAGQRPEAIRAVEEQVLTVGSGSGTLPDDLD